MAIAKLVKLAEFDVLKTYNAGEVILHEGEYSNEMYIIISGRVEISKNIDGNQYLLENLKDGDIFGEMALLDNSPHTVTVKAVDDTTLITIDKHKFEEVICQNMSLVYMLIRKLNKRMRKKDEELIKVLKNHKEKNRSLIKHLPKKVDKPQDNSPQQKASGQYKSEKLIFPEQQAYSINDNQANPDKFLYDKKVICPICQNVFHTKGIRASRLTLVKTELDLRQRFLNFEPLWYKIWVCPHCYYASFDTEFLKPAIKEKVYASEQTKKLQKETNFQFSSPRKVEEVIKAYYLALNCTQDVLKMGRIWLYLSWLYQDVDDAEMFKKAIQKALQYYQEAYFNVSKENSADQDQRLRYLLGELFLRNGQTEEARKYYFNSIIHRGGNPIINRQAQIRVDELRKNK